MGPEARIQKAAIAFATSRGVPYVRMAFRPGLTAGWPDVLFLVTGGRPLWIEFKAPGKKPTELQQPKIDLLRALGYDVCCCDSFNSARDAIASALAAAALYAQGGGAPGGARSGRFSTRPGLAENLNYFGSFLPTKTPWTCAHYVGGCPITRVQNCLEAGGCQVDTVQAADLCPSPWTEKDGTPKIKR